MSLAAPEKTSQRSRSGAEPAADDKRRTLKKNPYSELERMQCREHNDDQHSWGLPGCEEYQSILNEGRGTRTSEKKMGARGSGAAE